MLAFFSDGPLALFLIMVPLFAITQDKQPSIKIGLRNTFFFSILVCICFFTFFYLEPQALNNTKHFLYEQVFAVLSGKRTEGGHSLGHFFIIGVYFRYYIGVCILSGIIIAIAAKIENTKFRNNLFSKLKNKNFILFVSLSIISSWPIAISGKQYAYYAMQSAPFFALAMIHLCFDSYQIILNYCKNRINFTKTAVYSSSLLCMISLFIIINSAGGYNKDKNIIQDIYYLQNHVLPKNSILSVSRAIGTFLTPADAYFERYAMISLTPNLQEYYLTMKGQPLPEGYKKLSLPLTVFVLAHREKLITQIKHPF